MIKIKDHTSWRKEYFPSSFIFSIYILSCVDVIEYVLFYLFIYGDVIEFVNLITSGAYIRFKV